MGNYGCKLFKVSSNIYYFAKKKKVRGHGVNSHSLLHKSKNMKKLYMN